MPGDVFEGLEQYTQTLTNLFNHASITKVAQSDAFKKMSDDIAQLYATMSQLSKPVDGKMPTVNQSDYDALQQQYASLSQSLQDFGTYAMANNTPEMAVAVSGLNRLVHQDQQALSQVGANGRDTLSSLMTKCRNVQVDIPAQTVLGKEGQAFSSRIPMRFEDGAGKKREGFFTKDYLVSDATKASRAVLDHGGETGSSIAERNVAMSRFASLAGCPNLLAQSVKMKATIHSQTDTGPAVEEAHGVFMDTAVGTDIDRATPDEALQFLNHTFTDEAIRQIADMQMIDAICSNADRHEGNLLYQMEKDGLTTVITGVVGIDNDYSFSATKGPSIDDEHLFGLNSIQICTTSMAQKLSLMDRNAFDLTFNDVNLTPNEKDRAWKRVESAKERIATNQITVVPDGEFSKMLAETEAMPREASYDPVKFELPKGIYKQLPLLQTVKEGMKKRTDMALRGRIPEREHSQIQYADVDFVSNGAQAKQDFLMETGQQLVALRDKLSKTGGFFTRNSAQYKDMMQTLNDLPDPTQVQQSDLDAVSNAVKAYNEQKKGNLSGSVAKSRFALTSELENTLDHAGEKLQELNQGPKPQQAQTSQPARVQMSVKDLPVASNTNPPVTHTRTATPAPARQATQSGPTKG